MSEFTVAVVAGIVGALVGAGGSFLLYLKQRADSRHADEKRATESGLEAQRRAAREQFKCAYSAKVWLSSLPAWVGAPDSPARPDEVREEAMTRSNKCHEVWDIEHMKVDSMDVQTAMGQLDLQLQAVLSKVVDGNLSPDLAPVEERLHALKDVANRRLNARI